MPPLRLFPAAPEQVKITERGPFLTLEWMAPVRNRDGSEDIQLEAAEVLRRVIEIPPPPPAPVMESSLEAVEEPSLREPTEEPEPAKEAVEGEPPPQEETAPPVQPETEEPEVTPSKEQLAEPAETEAKSPTTPAGVAPAEQAPPPPLPFEQEATVITTVESVQGGATLTFRDPWDPEWEGMRVEYAVRYVNRKGRRGVHSPVKSIDPLPPIDPPGGVTAEIEEGLVRIRWSPVGPSNENVLSFLFNVYRRSDADLYPRDPLNGEPINGALYEDRSTSYDQEYCYVVRSVAVHPEPEPERLPEPAEEATEGTAEEMVAETTEPVPGEAEPEVPSEPFPGETAEAVSEEAKETTPGETIQAAPQPAPVAVEKPLIESVDSEEVCLTPKDAYPPPAPTHLFAVEVSDGILLSWDDVPAQDLGGYLVYRSDDDSGPFERVTELPVPLASYTDRTTEPGVVYFYTVSAVDRAEPWNEGPRSGIASAQAAERP